MQTITKALTDIVTAAFVKCGYPEASGVVTPSDRLDLCQFQCNGAFAAAKAYRKAPIAIESPQQRGDLCQGGSRKARIPEPYPQRRIYALPCGRH